MLLSQRRDQHHFLVKHQLRFRKMSALYITGYFDIHVKCFVLKIVIFNFPKIKLFIKTYIYIVITYDNIS